MAPEGGPAGAEPSTRPFPQSSIPRHKLSRQRRGGLEIIGPAGEGVTEAAGHLQREGIISYRRGHIKVIDRTGLETQVCECYGVLKKELSRLLLVSV